MPRRLLGLTLIPLLAGQAAWASDRDHGTRVKGAWTNPVGACVGHIAKTDPATGDVLGCTGTSKWTGTWKGSTTWRLTGRISLTAGGSGRIHEVFTGRARDGRRGTLTFSERFTLAANGDIDITGRIGKSSGRLAHSHGRARWVGTTAADGSGRGTYSGRWREGRRSPAQPRSRSPRGS
jgi:hypothetical protein